MAISRESFDEVLRDGRGAFSNIEPPQIDWLSELQGAPFGRSTDNVNARLDVDTLADTILSSNGFGDGDSRQRIQNELIYLIDNGSVWTLARELNTRLQAAGSDMRVTGEIQPYKEWTQTKPPMEIVAGHQAILSLNRGDDFLDRVKGMRYKDANRR